MNTADILEKCRTLPGVTVEARPGHTALLLDGEDGTGSMCFYPLFPGVTLAVIRVNASVWPAPQPERCTPDATGPLIINYCTSGRCELILNDNRHVFLSAGEISLTERFAQREYLYPGRVYEGLELFIDPETARTGQPVLREYFGVELSRLREKYCPGGETFIGRLPLGDDLLARLAPPEKVLPHHMKTGVIDLLALLLAEASTPKAVRPVYYTRSQVAIAKQVERIITGDLSRQHTVREFAERFSVSESSVKNYFFGVFGQSISQYTARQRMLLAAELLAGTRLSVIQVANRVGYLNQSKFSAAFRRAYGRTPLEYRRERRMSQLPSDGLDGSGDGRL